MLCFFLEKCMSANLVSLSESGKVLGILEKTSSFNLRNEPLNTVPFKSSTGSLMCHEAGRRIGEVRGP